MNLQVTVLKILVSYPDGFAVMADLKRDMAILVTGGRDWAERTRRLAARAPSLDIFSQGLVEHLNGRRITEKGRAVLELMPRYGRSAAPAAGAFRFSPGGIPASCRQALRQKPATAAPSCGTRAGPCQSVLSAPCPAHLWSPGKTGNFADRLELPAIGSVAGSVKMVDDVVSKTATETAWTVYRARNLDVGPQDSRRCLLERHLQRRGEERESDAEELAGFRIAYLHRLPRVECSRP
ncbi:hypothetical protein [Bradyrhizobium sp. CB1015]|uniref:hypothetical protein n=1 Tax=Bradyrhizobium sp. CB1015 TaxID=2976822 RepID=UPI003906432B